MTRFICLIMILTLIGGCSASKLQSGGVNVSISLTNPDSVSSKSVRILAIIKNTSNAELEVPDLLYWGTQNDPISDFILELQIRNKTTDEFKLVDIPDNYQHMYEKVLLTKLRKNETKNDTSNLAFYYLYNIPHGEYRLRVIYKASRHNPVQDVVSNWVKFVIN